MKRIISLVLTAVMLLCFAACDPIVVNPGKETEKAPSGPSVSDPYANKVYLKMEVRDFGTMTIELYPDLAPVTVENFLKYVDEGFYDGLTFHRIYNGLVIQGGDPSGNGTGGSDLPTIKGEFKANGYNNPLSHTYGVLSMARRSSPYDSATSQFFICISDKAATFDGNYATFGKVTEGYDVLDAIAKVELKANPITGEKSMPVTPVYIDRVYRVD